MDSSELNMEEIQQKVKELQEEQNEKQAALTIVREEVTRIQKAFDAATSTRLQLEREQASLRNELREQEKALATAQRLQLVKDEQARLQKEFEEKSAELDSLTASAQWREFAFDHQIIGGKKLALAKRGILGDKRGLGKTLTSLIFLDMAKSRKILVVAPNDVVPQFEDEIRAWAPKRTIFPLRGLPKAQRDFVYPLMHQADEYIATINYEAWRRDKTIIDDLVKAGLDTVVCDEGHRMKSSDKVTARGVFQVAYRPNYCSQCDKVDNFMGSWLKNGKITDIHVGMTGTFCPNCSRPLSSTVQNVVSATGTPIINKPQELFSMLYLVDKNRFPSESAFLRDYCYQAAPNKWRFRPGGLERLTKFMSEFFLQRTREDAGIHIPPPAIKLYEIEKDHVKYHKQYTAEKTITEKAALLLEDGARKDIFFILELILRERQCMVWPAGITITDPETKEILCHFDVQESQKLDEVTELATELIEEGERVVLFSQFRPPLYELNRRLSAAGAKVAMATGDQPEWSRELVRKDFDLKTAPETPRYDIALATYKAFGTGINLNAARHAIILDDEWAPGYEDQAIGRIDRLNSVDQATVHIFRVKDSIDDWMAKLLEEKQSIVDGFNEQFDEVSAMTNFFFKERG